MFVIEDLRKPLNIKLIIAARMMCGTGAFHSIYFHHINLFIIVNDLYIEISLRVSHGYWPTSELIQILSCSRLYW